MNQALVQDVVAEVMRRLDSRSPARPASAGRVETGSSDGVRAGEDAPANEGKLREAPTWRRGPAVDGAGRYGIFANVDDAVSAATEAQKKLGKLSLDERDAIVKLIKSLAKLNAAGWVEMELKQTKIGRLDHKIEKLQILELVPGVEFLKTDAYSGSNGVCMDEYAPYGVIGAITPVTHSVPTLCVTGVMAPMTP